MFYVVFIMFYIVINDKIWVFDRGLDLVGHALEIVVMVRS